MDKADRRRVVFASAITVLALPSLLLMNRDEPTGPATVAPGGIVMGAGATPDTTLALQRAMGTAGGAYLATPEIPAERPRAAGEPLPIAVPAQRSGALLSGRASYRSSIPGQSVCLVTNAPQSARVTITNVDNGRSVTCVSSVSSLGSRDDVVLHTDAFTRIADLTDAPIPVEITW